MSEGLRKFSFEDDDDVLDLDGSGNEKPLVLLDTPAEPVVAAEQLAVDAVNSHKQEPAWKQSWNSDTGRGRNEKGHYTTFDKEYERALAENDERQASDAVPASTDSEHFIEPSFLPDPDGNGARPLGEVLPDEPVFDAVPPQGRNGETSGDQRPWEQQDTNGNASSEPGWQQAWGLLDRFSRRNRTTNGATEAPAASATAPSEPAHVEAPTPTPAAPERLMNMSEAELTLAEAQFTGFQTELATYYADFAATTGTEQIALLAQLMTELHAMQAGVEGLGDEQQATHRPQLEFFQEQLSALTVNALNPRRIQLSAQGNYVEANRRMVDMLRAAVADGQVSDTEMQEIAAQMTRANIGLDSAPGRARMAAERRQLRQAAVTERNNTPIDRDAHRQAAEQRVQRALQAVLEATVRVTTSATVTGERVGRSVSNTADRTIAVYDALEATVVQAVNDGANAAAEVVQEVLALQSIPAEARAAVVDIRQNIADRANGLVDSAQSTVARGAGAAVSEARGVIDGLRDFGRQFADALATIGPGFERAAETLRRRAEERSVARNWDIAETSARRAAEKQRLLDVAAQRKANPRGLRGLRATLASWAKI